MMSRVTPADTPARSIRSDHTRISGCGTPDTGGGKVLVVDDGVHVGMLARAMAQDGYQVVSTPNGRLAVDAVLRERPHVVLIDVNMPDVDGFEACRQLKQHPATRLVPVILLTGPMARLDRIQAIEAGADDFLSKVYAFDELRARIRSLTRAKRHTDELESAESVILSLALIIEARDPAIKGHCDRLAHYAVTLGEQLGLDADQRIALHRGGFVHDIGKVGISDAILLKPAALSPAETLEMQQHPIIGEKLCGNLRSLDEVREIVRHHHERPDGSGYPDRLRGDEIPLLASVMGVVDAYDAMTTARPYKPAFTREAACYELRSEARRGWKHATIVDAFIDLLFSDAFAEVAPN
jgi:putative two-component system response regulator